MFESILTADELNITSILLCTGASLVFGLIISLVYMLSKHNTKSFAITLVLMPTIVQFLMVMVNGNVGTGIAVLGAFSLIRFRSVPGDSIDICYIFFAMSIGIATGMGYLMYALIITVILCVVMLLLSKTSFGEKSHGDKTLTVVIPEDLDYTNVFDDLFKKYTNSHKLVRVKTTNLGSMFELKYSINLKNNLQEKKFIDDIRCRNGNLTVMCSHELPVVRDQL